MDALDEARRALEGAKALALGPGLGRRDGTRALVRSLLESVPLPTVIDADAIGALRGARLASQGAVITPHPGEMSRLLDCPLDTVLADPIETAREAARRMKLAVRSSAIPWRVAPSSLPSGPFGFSRGARR